MKSYFQKQTSSFNLCSRIVFQIYEYTKLVKSESDTEVWSLSLGISQTFHFILLYFQIFRSSLRIIGSLLCIHLSVK